MNLNIPTKKEDAVTLVTRKPVLKVVGLGGGGSNAINRMIELGLTGVDFIAANTDSQALKNSLAPIKIQLGPHLTRGLGAGGNPQVGRGAAEESVKDLERALVGADMVFLTAGMGGGTGTGSIATAARVAKGVGAVSVAVVTMPFSFEIGRRQKNAAEGLVALRQHTDTLITIPNDRLLQVAPRDLPLDLAFRLADDVLRQGIQGISELITEPGLINVDFAHIRQVMQMGGGSILSIGVGEGEDKARQAIERALHHPLLDSIHLENSTGIIANFTAGPDLSFVEVVEALNELQAKANYQAEIIPGVITDPRMSGRAQVILIITGLSAIPVDVTFAKRSEPVIASTPAAAAPGQRPVQTHTPQPAVEPASLQSDLELPAFLRRRTR